MMICSISFMTQLNACSCIGIPETFLKDYQKGELVIHVEVIGHEAPTEEYYPTTHGITKLKVLQVLSGSLKQDIVYFVSGSSAACQGSIHGLEIGKEMILKPGIAKGADKTKTYINGSICSRWIQPMENGRVTGTVTKTRMAKRHDKMQALAEKGDEKSLKCLEKLSNKPFKSQKMRVKKLKRILAKV